MTQTLLKSQQAFGGDGWQPANETWTYASASTITVPSGAASKYAKGDKIKLTQTTVRYFYIIGVADTVLTVTGGSDYTVADAVISANYYSHQSSPIGFPSYLNTATTTFSTSYIDDNAGGAVSTTNSYFTISGNICHWNYKCAVGYKVGAGVLCQINLPTTLPTATLSMAGSGAFGLLNVALIHSEAGYFFAATSLANDAYFNQIIASVTYLF